MAVATRRVQITIPALHSAQQSIVDNARRYNVLCCGRRFGKDVLALDRIVDTVLDGRRCAWFAPTYKQLLEVWRTLVDTLAPIITRRSEQDHRLEAVTGGVVDMWSLDSPDTARGRAYHRVVLNEAAQVDGLMDAWQMVIRPTLTDYAGDAWFLSTPKGFNSFHSIYNLGLDIALPDWRSWHYPTSANPYISAVEVDAARRELPPRVFAQEYEADFVGSAGCLFEVNRILDYRRACKPPIETRLGGAIQIWQRPVVGRRYVCGADVAEGLDAGNDRLDYSTAAIYDWQTCVHVADIHGQWPVDVYADHLGRLCREYNNALLGVERNNHGHAVLLALRTLGYPSIYEHEDKDELAVRGNRPRRVAGWPTTAKSKPVMEQDFGALLASGGLCSYDVAVWDECLSYVNLGNGHTGAQEGCHDDRVMAHMVAVQMRKAVVATHVPISMNMGWGN